MIQSKNKEIVIVGGGAAGFFAAITCAENYPEHRITILEKDVNVLKKVNISGGGRCNVTHHCYEPDELVKNYPRGQKALKSAFNRFHALDTVRWFQSRGVMLKVEEDNRIFPASNKSQTIIDCLLDAAKKNGVIIKTKSGLNRIETPSKENGRWRIVINNGKKIYADRLLIATGSNYEMFNILSAIGHTIATPVPSLFTFNINDTRIKDLAGISVYDAAISIEDTKLKASGSLLITHWGMSGTAVLRLSSWGARLLNEKNYKFNLHINWVPSKNVEQVKDKLYSAKSSMLKKYVSVNPLFNLPSRLWGRFVTAAGIKDNTRWAELSKKDILKLAGELSNGKYKVAGKSTFKEEFVTCGGVNLKEVDFKTMQSKIYPDLFFAGEVLDIDALTGGFNFQSAWTTGWIAGMAIGSG